MLKNDVQKHERTHSNWHASFLTSSLPPLSTPFVEKKKTLSLSIFQSLTHFFTPPPSLLSPPPLP